MAEWDLGQEASGTALRTGTQVCVKNRCRPMHFRNSWALPRLVAPSPAQAMPMITHMMSYVSQKGKNRAFWEYLW